MNGWKPTGIGNGYRLKRPDKYPMTDRWHLDSITTSDNGGYWLIFRRRRGDGIVIRVPEDARVHIIHQGLVQGMKKRRRQRVEAIAHQAVAYCTLMGTLEGSPEHDEI